MKLFGKKDNAATPDDPVALSDTAPGLSDGPEAFDAGAGMDEMEADDAGAMGLAAPSRKFAMSGGGNRKALLGGAALLTIVALGAGYYFFVASATDYTAPQQVNGNVAAVPAATPPAATPVTPPPGATAAAMPGAPGAPAVPATPVPGSPAAAATPVNATASATAALGTPPEDANATPLTPGAAPATPGAATATPGAATAAAATPGAAAPGAAAPGTAAPGAPLVNPAQPGTPASVNAKLANAPGEMPPDMPPSSMMAPSGIPAGAPGMAAPAMPGTTPGMPATAAATPATDLPMPAGAMMQPPGSTAAAGTTAATATGATTPATATTPSTTATGSAASGTTSAATPGVPPQPAPAPASTVGAAVPAPGAKPNEAEMAIVQNSAVLDQLSQPAKPGAGTLNDPTKPKTVADSMKSVEQLLETQAIVRPLPGGYVTVRKDHDAGDVDTRLVAARTALNSGRSAAALQMFDDLHRDYPKDARILMGRAVALQKTGQNDEALAGYEDVLNRDPKNLQALTNMLGLLKAKDPALATEKLEELHRAYPYQPDIAAQLGIAYGSAGKYAEAERYLDMADSLKPGSGYIMYNRAVLYDKEGKSTQAGELYRQILQMSNSGDLDQQLPVEQIRARLSSLK